MISFDTMAENKPLQLEFTDCSVCGKRVATTALVCRHCNTKRTPIPSKSEAPLLRARIRNEFDEESDHDDSHFALSYGGYDDHEIEAESEENKSQPKRTFWWYIAWMLLIVFLISALLPAWL